MKTLFLLLFISVSFSVCAQKTENEKMNNLINIKDDNMSDNYKNNRLGTYKIATSINRCQGILLIDDVPSFQFWGEKSKFSTTTYAQANHILLFSGKHEIKLQLFPKPWEKTFEKYAFGGLEFFYYDDLTFNQEYSLFKITTPSEKDNNIGGLPYYELKTELEVELPFDIIGWRNSVNLKDENENGLDISKELHQKITEIREIIAKRDVNQFSNLIKEREALLETAFYFTKDEANQGLNDFLELIKDTNYELVPLPENANLHFYGYGKLITLLTPERERVITLVNKNDPKDKIVLDFYFHRKQKGKPLEVIL